MTLCPNSLCLVHLLSVPRTQGTKGHSACSQLFFQRPVNMVNLYFFLHKGKMSILIITMYSWIHQGLHSCFLLLVTYSPPHLWTLWNESQQAPQSMGFPRQEYWSGLQFPSPGNLGDLLLGKWILYHWATWEPGIHVNPVNTIIKCIVDTFIEEGFMKANVQQCYEFTWACS